MHTYMHTYTHTYVCTWLLTDNFRVILFILFNHPKSLALIFLNASTGYLNMLNNYVTSSLHVLLLQTCVNAEKLY